MVYKDIRLVKSRNFHLEIKFFHWTEEDGSWPGEHWWLMLYDSRYSPTNYDKLDPMWRFVVKSTYERLAQLRGDTKLADRVSQGHLPTKKRKVVSEWPSTLEEQLGQIDEGRIQSIQAWLDGQGASELKSETQRTIGDMQKKFASRPEIQS